MKRDIFFYILEICITISVILVSVPMWNNFEKNKTIMEKTMAVGGLELTESEKNNTDLTISDGKAFESNSYDVNNNSNYNLSGKLYLKYAKKSLLDYHYLNISIDNEVSNLEYLYDHEDNNYYYFLIDAFNLNGGEKENYNISFIVKDECINEARGKGFIYHINIDTSTNM